MQPLYFKVTIFTQVPFFDPALKFDLVTIRIICHDIGERETLAAQFNILRFSRGLSLGALYELTVSPQRENSIN